MGYPECEAAAQTLIQALSTFSDADVSRTDFRILDANASPPYCIMLPGAFSRERLAPREADNTWEIILRLFERAYDDGTEWTAMQTTRQTIIDTIDANPTLNSANGTDDNGNNWQVVRAMVTAGDAPDYETIASGSKFLVQELSLTVRELADIGGGEYA